MESPLGREIAMHAPVAETIDRVTEALGREGFGILTRVDVHTTLRAKLGKEFREYVILGACHPALALRALEAHAEVGLIMPCNVTVEATGEGRSVVRLGDPDALMSVGHLGANAEVRKIAREVAQRVDRVEESLRSGA
jgi:uncharacterized protein (DUF302 family)